MAGNLRDVWERKLLDLIFRNTAASATTPMGLDATNLWVALFTVAPTDSTDGTEVAGGSYARVAVARTGAGFAAASGTTATTSNSATVTFPTATADWAANPVYVVAYGFCSSLAGALSTDLVFWFPLTAQREVKNGDSASFSAGALTVTCD